MQFFRMKNLSVFVVLLLVSCAALTGGIKYPQTPAGQAALMISAYHDQVDVYLADVSWATDENHIKMLNGRLRVFQTADPNFKEIARLVASGGTIPEALLRSTKASLTELKRYLYAKQSIAPSDATVERALEKALLIPETRSHGWESIVILLIELVQAFAPMMDRLIQMGEMTPEQIQAEFQYQHDWVLAFDPAALPKPITAQ